MDEDEEVVFIWRLRLHVHVIVSKASPRGLGAKGQSCSLSWASTRLVHPGLGFWLLGWNYLDALAIIKMKKRDNMMDTDALCWDIYKFEYVCGVVRCTSNRYRVGGIHTCRPATDISVFGHLRLEDFSTREEIFSWESR